MDVNAIRTIRIHNFKATRPSCVEKAQKFLDTLTKHRPMGFDGESDNDQYYVMPGYEHVTKYQPIAIYSGTEGEWQLSSTSLFVQP